MAEALKSIPLSQLVSSDQNVRKTGAGAGLEELVANIAANGLLQNLTVRPTTNAKGKPSGKYEVIAGSRRLAALVRLAEQKRIPKNFAVPCLLIDGHDPISVSLAENVVRAPLHPADQFEAFAKLYAAGLSAVDIAARFGIRTGRRDPPPQARGGQRAPHAGISRRSPDTRAAYGLHHKRRPCSAGAGVE